MAYLADGALDALLDYIQDAAAAGNVDLHICSQEPATYAEATSTYSLGSKTDASITGPTDASTGGGDPVNGRKIDVAAFTDGTVSANGTATHQVLVNTLTTELLFSRTLGASKAVATGSPFELSAWAIYAPDYA